MNKRLVYILLGTVGLLTLCVVLALTVFRPVTAKVYHNIRCLYEDFALQKIRAELYDYQPDSEQRVDVTDFTLSVPEALTAEEEALYARTVSQVLTQQLWAERDMYDAAYTLMVPMHFAFSRNDQEKMEEFHGFFDRFFQDISTEDTQSFLEQPYNVDRIQFLYFCCEYLRLCALTGTYDQAPEGLYNYLYDEMEYIFTEIPGNWGVEKNAQAHIEQVLLGKTYSRSYYGSLSDYDLIPLAGLCDLRVIASLTGKSDTKLMKEAAHLAYSLYSNPYVITETEKGGWLFQVGVCSDYPDFQYVGNAEVTPDIQPKPREDIVGDSSHFMEHALWLSSFQQAQTYQEYFDLFQLRQEQLANQLINYVIQYVDGKPLATTFMDGTCGVYRYSYNAEGVGHQGYSLSCGLLYGWWSFLGDARIDEIYADLLDQFPMTADLDNPYFDYATTREQNPFFDMNTSLENGMAECMVMLAGKIKGV